MRDANVVGFIPSNAEAPSGPKILPVGLFKGGGGRFSLLAFELFACQETGFPRRGFAFDAPRFARLG
jgi:hypothetical protein